MGYTRFSTDNANYHLEYALHFRKTPLNDMKSLDAIVLESADMEWEDADSIRHPCRQYSDIVGKAEKLRVPIYMPDVDKRAWYNISSAFAEWAPTLPIPFFAKDMINAIYTGRITNISGLLAVGGLAYLVELLGFVLLGTSLNLRGEVKNSIVEKYVTLRSMVIPSVTVAGRNAINSEKIEQFIVPKVRSEIERKPNIGLVFGAGHAGIKRDLKHPKWRKSLIKFYSKLNFSMFDDTNLDSVLKYRFDGEKWNFEKYSTNLFIKR
jgi:hypothetical protein